MDQQKQEVENALSQEEKPIIENIISLFQQLLTMQDAQQQPAQPTGEVMQSGYVKPAEEEEMEEVDKSADGETGDDPAEKRIEEVTPTTDSSLDDLKKSVDSLVSVINGKKVVNKTLPVPQIQPNQNVQVLTQISTVLKTILEKQNAQDTLNSQLFEAIGISNDVIKKSLPEQSKVVAKDKPIQGLDTASVIKEVMTEVFKNIPSLNQNRNPEYQNPFNQKRDVRKNLRDLAQFIHEGTNRTTR